MNTLIGIDVGTTQTKGGIFSGNEELISQAKSSYALSSQECAGAATTDPEDWWRAAKTVLKECAMKTTVGEVGGICIGSQGPSLVALDEKGNPVRSSLLWLDERAVQEAKFISSRIGRKEDPTRLIPKALWIKNNEPEIYKKIRWFCQPVDYVSYKLTGKIRSSISSEPLNPWDDKEISAAGIDRDLLPPLIKMGEYLGEVTSAASGLTDIPAGSPVFAGTGGADFIEVLVGTATLKKGRICDRAGTSQGVDLCWDKSINDQGLFSVPHPIAEGQFSVAGLMSTTGKALQWHKDLFYGKNVSYEEILKKASSSPPGSNGLLFLPYLSGARTPWWDPYARGSFVGLSLRNTKGDFIRAILEGVAFGINQIIRIFKSNGVTPGEIRICGGQADSPLWNQIKADVTGLAVKVPEITDGEILGLTIIAGKGAGIFDSIVDAAENLVKFSREYVPKQENHRLYSRLQETYEGLYPSLKDTFIALSKLNQEAIYGDGKTSET